MARQKALKTGIIDVTGKLTSLANKRLNLIGLAIVSLAVIFVAQQQIGLASFGFEGLGRDIDRGISDAQQGSSDGKQEGIADYPNRDQNCPDGNSVTYCVGWVSGYGAGFNAQKTVSESGSNGDSNNDD